MWYGKTEFSLREERRCCCKTCQSNDEWAPTIVIQNKCDCEKKSRNSKIKRRSRKTF